MPVCHPLSHQSIISPGHLFLHQSSSTITTHLKRLYFCIICVYFVAENAYKLWIGKKFCISKSLHNYLCKWYSKISKISDFFYFFIFSIFSIFYIYRAFAHRLLKLYEIYYQIVVCVCVLCILGEVLLLFTLHCCGEVQSDRSCPTLRKCWGHKS